MFLALDPGTRAAPVLEEDARIQVTNSAPDVNPDEILAVLDSDTRAYLKVLINGAGKGLAGRALDLRQVFRRLGPLHRDLDRLNSLVVQRRRNLARLVHNYGSTVSRLGKEDEDLTALVNNASKVFTRLSQEDTRISERRVTPAQRAAPDGGHAREGRRAGPGGGADLRGAASRRAPDRRRQLRAPAAGADRRAGPA